MDPGPPSLYDHRHGTTKHERRINKAIDFITSHLTKNPSLDEIAEAASFSKFHFHRLFQAHVGETVLEFTRRLRLEKAASQLHFDRDKDVTAVALDCGFSSSQNFAKAFKKHFSMSPTVYRQSDAYLNGRNDERPGSKDGNTIRKDGNTIRKDGNTLRNPGNAAAAALGHSHDDFDNRSHQRKDKIVARENVEVKDVPSLHVAYVRTIGEYGYEPAAKAFEALEHWAGPRGLLQNGQFLGVPWDDPNVTPAEKCRYDACVTVPEGTEVDGAVDRQTLPGGRNAVHHAEIIGNDFESGWNHLIGEWLPNSGYQPGDGPAYEVYLNDGDKDPQGRWLVDIHLPVKPL